MMTKTDCSDFSSESEDREGLPTPIWLIGVIALMGVLLWTYGF